MKNRTDFQNSPYLISLILIVFGIVIYLIVTPLVASESLKFLSKCVAIFLVATGTYKAHNTASQAMQEILK